MAEATLKDVIKVLQETQTKSEGDNELLRKAVENLNKRFEQLITGNNFIDRKGKCEIHLRCNDYA